MDRKQENSQSNADAVFFSQEPKMQFLKPRDPARSASSEGSGSSPSILWSPSSRFGSLRLSSSESDDVFLAGCLQHVSLKDEKRVETEPMINCEEIKIEDIEDESVEMTDEVTLKRNEEEHTVIKEKQFRGPKEDISKKKDCTSDETEKRVNIEGEKTKKTTQMSVIIPPTSHLALRRKLKRQPSNLLPVRTCKESVGSTHDATNKAVLPGSNMGANIDLVIPPRKDCYMHQKFTSQTYNPALPAAMPEKSVDSTRHHTHNVLLSTSVAGSTPAMIALTSNLAMRRKLTRQASNPLPVWTFEESMDFPRDIAHNMVLSTPSVPLTSAVISATSNPAMSRTLKRQTSKAMPTGMGDESVYSAAQVTTRDVTRGAKNPLRLPPLSSSLNPVDIPPTSHVAQRPKLKRQASNPLPAETSAESTRSPTHPVQFHVVFPAMQNINQPTHPPKTPRSATGHGGKQLLYPEDWRVPAKSKRKTRARRLSDSTKRSQKEKRALEKHSDPLRVGNSSNSLQPRVQLPQQRAQSRDCMSSSSRSSAQDRNMSAIVVPPRPSRLHTVKEPLPPLQPSGGENPKRSVAVGRVLAVKAKDNRPLSLPAIPVERLINKGFFLVPDMGRTSSTPSGPLNNSYTHPPLPKAQMKQQVCQTKSLGATESVSSRQNEESKSIRAGYRKGLHEGKS